MCSKREESNKVAYSNVSSPKPEKTKRRKRWKQSRARYWAEMVEIKTQREMYTDKHRPYVSMNNSGLPLH